MKHLLRIVVGLLIGAIGGAIVGAAMLAVPALFDNKCGRWGCTRDWAPIAAVLGGLYGGVPGAVIGAITGIASSSRLKSMGIGAIVGLIIAIPIFRTAEAGDAVVISWGILSIPGGALVGLAVREFLRLVRLSPKSGVSVESEGVTGPEPTH
ncbi:MAG TPA: hypothetical protein VIF64_05155 [Pyrinomonadaceae bacterium]